MALEAEPIELVESAGDEIVDLTCESLEPVVVDLTHNDSVVVSGGAWALVLLAVGPWLARPKALVTGYSTQGGNVSGKSFLVTLLL